MQVLDYYLIISNIYLRQSTGPRKLSQVPCLLSHAALERLRNPLGYLYSKSLAPLPMSILYQQSVLSKIMSNAYTFIKKPMTTLPALSELHV